MRGGFIPSHYVLDLDEREGATLRRVLEDLSQDDQFTMNEFEEELVQGVLTALDPPERETEKMPISP